MPLSTAKIELEYLMNKLVVNNKPTDEYYNMVFKQREWLLKYGTTEAYAGTVLGHTM